MNRDDIVFSLRLMGISEGDTLLLHSALTAIGQTVEGGADAVIDAFLEAVGESGTLAMSSLTGWAQPFDPGSTPSAVGLISERFRQRPGTLRSRHPVHSICARGRQAEYLTAGHEKCETGCGEGTPYYKLRDLGGKVVLLGVDMDRNTLMHSLEEEADSRYLLTLDIPAPTYMDDYENRQFTLKKFPPGHRDFLSFTPELRARGALVEGRIGRAVVKVIDAGAMFDIGAEVLIRDPFSFICENESCNFCVWARGARPLSGGHRCLDDNCEICVIPEGGA